jgi:hypothetical protein
MRIQVSDPSSTPQLILFLRSSGITAFREKKEGELNVAGVVSTDAVQAVLTTWNDSKEGATAKIVG